MSYTVHFAFGASPGQTIHGQLLDMSFSASGSALTSGVTEVGNNGHYGYVATLADDFEGFIKFYVSGDTDDIVALFAVTGRELSPLDAVLESTAPSNAQNVDEVLRLMAATLLGKTSAGTTGWVARDTGDSKNRVTGTLDEQGYRTAVTLDGS